MKVLLATPNFHQPRGNTVTVQRIADGLKKLGTETEIISVTEDSKITSLPPADIVHGFHAYRFYVFKENLSKKPDSFVITLTGTDLNHDLFNEDKREDVLLCLGEAKAIHVFDDQAKQTLITEMPEIEPKIVTIHQGTSVFPNEKQVFMKEEDTFLFTLPAGIRKVKNVPQAIDMLNSIHDRFPKIRLWIVGPIIEEVEGEVVNSLVEKNSDWVMYLGKVSHNKMGAIYSQTDALLNTSHSEGQSSAILEAMGYGLPVLVSGNQGNRNIVESGKTGFIYDTRSQFLDYAEEIMNNIELRQRIGQSAKRYIEEHHSGLYEAEKLLQIYQDVLK